MIGNSDSGARGLSVRDQWVRCLAPPQLKLGRIRRPQEASPSRKDVLSSVNSLQVALTVSRARGYILSHHPFTSTDPARAARLANAIADAYIVDKLDARFEAASRASSWLSERLVELRKQVRESEEAIVQFRAEHGLIQSSTNISLNQQQITDLQGRVLAAKAEAAEKKARLDMLNSVEARNGNLQTLPDLGQRNVHFDFETTGIHHFPARGRSGGSLR